MKRNTPDATVADSTVALTVYNCLTVSPSPLQLGQLKRAAIKLQHPGLKDEQLKRAVDGLLSRDRIKVVADTFYALKDLKRRPVVERDRSDAKVLPDGSVEGGWNGWKVKDGKKAVPLDSNGKGLV